MGGGRAARRAPVAGAARLVGAALAGYALGGLPSADVATRLATGGGTDLRSAGSGNPGAVNAMKVLGWAWGTAVLAADVAKGALACAVGRALAGGTGSHVGGTAAVVGHCFPLQRWGWRLYVQQTRTVNDARHVLDAAAEQALGTPEVHT